MASEVHQGTPQDIHSAPQPTITSSLLQNPLDTTRHHLNITIWRTKIFGTPVRAMSSMVKDSASGQ